VKKVFMGMVLLLLSGILIGSTAQAEPWSYQWDPDSGVVLGASTATTATQKQASHTFRLAWSKPIYISVIVKDTGAGNGALTDSLAVTLQKGFDHASADDLVSDSAWIDVVTLAAFDPTKMFDIHQFMSVDSVNLGAFEIGGLHRFLLHKGGGQTLDTVNGDYTIKVFVEAEGRD